MKIIATPHNIRRYKKDIFGIRKGEPAEFTREKYYGLIQNIKENKKPVIPRNANTRAEIKEIGGILYITGIPYGNSVSPNGESL